MRLIDRVKESQRELTVLKRLKRGEIVGLISDAGMLGISDPVSEFVSTFYILITCVFLTVKKLRIESGMCSSNPLMSREIGCKSIDCFPSCF